MIELTKSEFDDIDFIKKVQTLTNEIIVELDLNEIYLFKINNWFDKKWLNFTGKILGLLGTWNIKDNTRIPPFSPNRILEERFYRKNKFGTYSKEESEYIIHKLQTAEKNHHRKIVRYGNSALFIWYSSNTAKNEHGSLMIYSVKDEKCDSFYVGFKKNKKWDIVSCPGTNKKLLEFYFNRSKSVVPF